MTIVIGDYLFNDVVGYCKILAVEPKKDIDSTLVTVQEMASKNEHILYFGILTKEFRKPNLVTQYLIDFDISEYRQNADTHDFWQKIDVVVKEEDICKDVEEKKYERKTVTEDVLNANKVETIEVETINVESSKDDVQTEKVVDAEFVEKDKTTKSENKATNKNKDIFGGHRFKLDSNDSFENKVRGVINSVGDGLNTTVQGIVGAFKKK